MSTLIVAQSKMDAVTIQVRYVHPDLKFASSWTSNFGLPPECVSWTFMDPEERNTLVLQALCEDGLSLTSAEVEGRTYRVEDAAVALFLYLTLSDALVEDMELAIAA